jgi:hypothetical protein
LKTERHGLAGTRRAEVDALLARLTRCPGAVAARTRPASLVSGFAKVEAAIGAGRARRRWWIAASDDAAEDGTRKLIAARRCGASARGERAAGGTADSRCGPNWNWRSGREQM